VSIGDTLAEARRGAGLTVTQVSQRTRIRETIIRGIEQDDFSACGGDFYARGHIRSIAAVVGVDPEPLISEYDEVHGSPQAIRAAEAFEPSTPIKIKERRRFNWTMLLAVVLLAVIAYGAYRLYGGSLHSHGRRVAAASHPPGTPHATPSARSASHSPSPSAAASPASDEVVIKLTAVQDCWVDLTDTSGTTIFSGIVPAGSSKTWKDRHPVTLRLGNPAGVVLTVDGKKQSPGTAQPVTLSFSPGGTSASFSPSSAPATFSPGSPSAG